VVAPPKENFRPTDELTTRSHWDEAWVRQPRWRLPSPLVVSTSNMQRLLRPYVRPGMRVLELGCAPGKLLAWAGARLGAKISGLDYSERGVAWAAHLFEVLGIPADVRCENIFETTFEPASFDLVYSTGLIEHFDDPRPIVRAHVNLTRAGGKAIMAIPDYGGIYGRVQQWFDPNNLALHNLSIMKPDKLEGLAPSDLSETVRAYRAGRLSPWQINFSRRWPMPLAHVANYGLNAVGVLQPVDIPPLCPHLVLEITRRRSAEC
jgi:2-polyprenyl-3-methyl-5-hydroxy-6-metoxy-1,4-benzoquinol methylase